jgi:hypothetical protein
MEDDLNFCQMENKNRPLYFGNLNTILILTNGKDIIFWEMEDDLNILGNGR